MTTMTNSTKHLFLFTIGPVQSFISQARKTRDLYAGSRILSQLCRAGVKAATKAGAKCIFPSENAINNDDASLPNRFLVKFEGNIDAKNTGEKVEDAVKNYWKDTICKEVLSFKEIKGVEEQIDNHLEIFWIFNDYKEDDYENAYTKIESLLGAVKNSRSFVQYNYQDEIGERGRKCSMDGERNVKFYRLGKDEQLDVLKDGLLSKLYQKEDEVFIDNQKQNRFDYSQLQSGEGLSAVSMTKRLFEKTKLASFPSTAAVALKYNIDKFLNGDYGQEDKTLFLGYKGFFNGNFDEQLLYEDNLTENYFSKHGLDDCIGNLQNIKYGHHKIKDNLKQKYYAIIDFDGDNMGKWLGGEKIKDKKQLEAFHTDLSQCLTNFGDEARKIVDKYGKTIYAGGDDFLGFLNLNYLFKAMSELRSKFKELVNDELTKYRTEEISFSAGVCIAHYKEPLSLVLGKAGKAQKVAKNEDKGDRNAFCITASKHSGEQHEVFYKWNNGESVVAFEYVVNKMQHEDFSNTFIKSLQVEFIRLMNDENRLASELEETLETEIVRLVKKACMVSKLLEETKEEFKIRKKEAIHLMAEKVKFLYTSQSNHQLLNFFEALNICDFLQRSFEKPEANEPKNEPILEPA